MADKILIVEDDHFSRALLMQQMDQQGYANVTVARDGEQALRILRKGSIDLVLLDIEMPGLDGIGVLRELKSDSALQAIPVIVISGVDDIASIVRCIELGAEDYLSKPFNPVILRARVSASLEKRRLRELEASRLAQVLHEQRKSEQLLHVILPAAAAEELKQSGAVRTRRHDCVGVLFCDIVGFTAYCDKHRAEDVVSRLQALIDRFERITVRHGMEKIKTIGDSFMATAGMLKPNPKPLAATIRCGLEMISATSELVPEWRVRVGVDCGPIVSGVLGRQRYQFDIWGGTVNVASRMTELASPGTVAMTKDCWLRVEGGFKAHCLGYRDVKGLGPREIVECFGAVA